MRGFYNRMRADGRNFTIMTLAFTLAACASLGLNTPSVDVRLKAANDAVTVIVNNTDQALIQHLITADQAESVSAIAHQVNPLLDAARAASLANDAAGADKFLNAVNQILAGLKAYVPPTPPLIPN